MVARRLVWWLVCVLVLLAAGVALAVPALAASSRPNPPATPAHAAPTAIGGPAAAPTLERLNPPPTVLNPNQADLGAQLFWQHCQPCHGDQGQGLTDDWRAQYPVDDQNCWNSGCHGDNPYQNGFTLPHVVPALVGPGTLNHFATAADLYAFMSTVMPFQAPGSLQPDEYWAITAFLLTRHGLPAADLPITDATIAQHIPLGAPVTAVAAPTAPLANPNGASAAAAGLAAAGAVVLALGGLGWFIWKRGRSHA